MTTKYNLRTFNEICDKNSHLWKPIIPLNPVDWLDKHFYLSGESASTQGRWSTYDFQRGLAFAQANLSIPIFIEMKPSQVGATKRTTGLTGYDLAHRRRNNILYQPTAEDANDYSITHFSSMLRDCPAVSEQMFVDPEKQHSLNTTKRRVFRGASCWISGAKTAQAFQRKTADTVTIEDLDRCDADVRGSDLKGEGSTVKLAWARTKTSQARKMNLISTPTIEGESLIEAEYLKCENKFRRELPCPGCGEFQELVFNIEGKAEYGLIFTDADDMSRNQKAESARYKCEHCSDEFDYSKLRQMDSKGRWASDNYLQKDSDGTFTDYDGNPVLPPREVAYAYSALLSRDEPWIELVREYLEAREKQAQGSHEEMKVFVNQYLGKPYKSPIFDEYEPGELIARLEDYDAECPDGVQIITIGIDCQKRYLDYEIVGHGAKRESWSLATGVILGIPDEPGDECWAELDEICNHQFKKADGTAVPILLAAIDEGYTTENVRSWCSKNPRQRVACKGVGTVGHELVRKRHTKPHPKYGIWTFNIGVHAASERLYTMLNIAEPGPGYCHFPKLDDYHEIDQKTGEITSDYFSQLTADKRVKAKRGGNLVEIFVNDEGRRNEKHDDRKLNICGIEILLENGHKLHDEPVKLVVSEPDESITNSPPSNLDISAGYAAFSGMFRN